MERYYNIQLSLSCTTVKLVPVLVFFLNTWKKITLKQKHINYLIPSIFVKFHKPYFYLQEKM
jgi:hypothetical protein